MFIGKNSALIAGLALSLGFSISWDPQNRQAAAQYRAEAMNERTLASSGSVPIALSEVIRTNGTITGTRPFPSNGTITSAPLETYDLGLLDPEKKGLKVFFEVDQSGSEKKVRYFVEGTATETCGDCIGLGRTHTEVLKDQNVQNIELIRRMVGEMAAQKITKKTEEKKKEEKSEKPAREKITSICEDEEDLKLTKADRELLQMGMGEDVSGLEERLSCKAEEFSEMAAECDSIFSESVSDMTKEERKTALTQRRDCSRKLALYYNKFIKKDLAKGLSSKSGAEGLAATVAFRDQVLSQIPKVMKGLRQDVLKVNQAGVLERGQAYYTTQLAQSQGRETPEAIATRTRLMMTNELHSSQSAGMCAAYTDLSLQNCLAANQNPAYRQSLVVQNSSYSEFNNNYLSPMEKLFVGSQRGGIDFNSWNAKLGLSGTDAPATTVDPSLGMPAAPDTAVGANPNALQQRGSAVGRGGGPAVLLPAPGSQTIPQGRVVAPTQIQGGFQTLPAPGINTAPAIGNPGLPRAYPTTSGQIRR